MPVERPPLTVQEAADRLGVHYMTAYRYVRTGRMAATRTATGWQVPAAEVDRVLVRPAAPVGRGGPKVDRAGRLRERMTAGDEPGAWTVCAEAMAAGMDPPEVYSALLVPALRAIGEGWLAGEVSVADEHRASAVAQRLVGRLGPSFRRPGRTRGTVVIGAPSGDLHSLPCAMLGDLLRAEGFDVVDVGANTPPESFADAARSAEPLVATLVGVTAPGMDEAARDAVAAVRGARPGTPVLVGGGAVRDRSHALALGADDWSGHDGAAAVAAVAAVRS